MQKDSKDLIKTRYLQTLPYLTSGKNQKFFSIVLTLCALSFFGFFAIKPTVSTILNLKKEIDDNEFVLNQLETKIKNLTELRKKYFEIEEDLPIITNAITVQPDPHLLLAQIQSIAQASNIAITKLQNSEVEILRNDKDDKNKDKDYYSYSFSVAGTGSFENISKFLSTLTSMERVVNIDIFSINNISNKGSEVLTFTIQGSAFFKSNL